MDDDLLGNPAPRGDDDLLGGPPVAALEDDLLFGTVSSDPIPTGKENDVLSSATKAPLKISPVKEVAQNLIAFVTPNTYFLRILDVLDNDGRRTSTVTAVTDSFLQFLTKDQKIQREIKIDDLISVITQSQVVPKLIANESEMHAVVQIKSCNDVHLAFPKEGEALDAALKDFIAVLSAVCASVGYRLPVASLNSSDSLYDHIAGYQIEFRVRHQLAEGLAYRTELFTELNKLRKEENRLELSIASIRESTTGHEVVDVVTEVKSLESKIAILETKTNETKTQMQKAKQQLEDLQTQLEAERARRDQAVRSSVEEAQKTRLMKQVADYEIAKVAHKRELDRISAATAFCEERVRSRSDRYDARTLQLRIEELEDQLSDLNGRLSAKGEAHAKRVKALAENRRRIGQANEVIAQLKADLTEIESTPLDVDLSDRIKSVEVPNLEPIVPIGEEPAAKAPPSTKGIKIDEGDDLPTAPAPPAKKPTISLDDDDI